jgi:CII-binding regulator of phage lambda lysogenization HflD
MNFVESNAHALATLDSDDDESDRLSGKDFLLQLIDTAIGRNKDLNKYKSRVLQLENTVDTQSSRIEQLEDTCAMLKEQIKYLTESHEELKLLHSQCKPA